MMADVFRLNPLSDHPALARKARPCWRKRKCRSIGAAEAQLRSLLRRRFVKDAHLLSAYYCPFCGWYHIGRSHEREI